MAPLDRRRLDRRLGGRLARGQLGQGRLEALAERVGVAAAQGHGGVVARVVGGVEAPDVVERDRLEALDGAGDGMAVRRALVDERGERRLAEVLVGGVAQRVLEVVLEVGLEALEVVFVEGRLEVGVGQQIEEEVDVVEVGAAGERGHLLVHRDGVARGDRVELLQDLLVAVLLCGAVGDQGARQVGQTLLARRIVLRADPEPDHERHRRIVRHSELDGRGRRLVGRRRTRHEREAGDDQSAGGRQRMPKLFILLAHRRHQLAPFSTATVRRSVTKYSSTAASTSSGAIF